MQVISYLLLSPVESKTMINPPYSVRMRVSLKTINLHAFYHLFFRGYQKIYYSILIDKPESKLHVPIPPSLCDGFSVESGKESVEDRQSPTHTIFFGKNLNL